MERARDDNQSTYPWFRWWTIPVLAVSLLILGVVIFFSIGLSQTRISNQACGAEIKTSSRNHSEDEHAILAHKLHSTNNAPCSSCGILIIETRHPDIIIPTLRTVLDHTSSEWQVQLLHPGNVQHEEGAFHQLVRESGRALHITPWKNFTVKSSKDISPVMKDPKLWAAIEFEHVLVIQTDGVMCRPGLENYLQYDYIGAPWLHGDWLGGLFVGNGGMSLRSRSKMEWCASNYRTDRVENGVEDVFFSSCVYEHGNSADAITAATFSVEGIFYPTPVMMHKISLDWMLQKYPAKDKEKHKSAVSDILCRHCPAISTIEKVALGLNCEA